MRRHDATSRNVTLFDLSPSPQWTSANERGVLTSSIYFDSLVSTALAPLLVPTDSVHEFTCSNDLNGSWSDEAWRARRTVSGELAIKRHHKPVALSDVAIAMNLGGLQVSGGEQLVPPTGAPAESRTPAQEDAGT
jgi:hypothetical protein